MYVNSLSLFGVSSSLGLAFARGTEGKQLGGEGDIGLPE